MAEIQINPGGGATGTTSVEITDPNFGTVAEVQRDVSDFVGGSNYGLLSTSILYGYDGTNWRRVSVDIEGRLNAFPGGRTITALTTITFTGNGNSIYSPFTHSRSLAVNVQNVSDDPTTVIAVRPNTSTVGAGIYLPRFGVMSFNYAVDVLVADVISGAPTGKVNVTIERN